MSITTGLEADNEKGEPEIAIPLPSVTVTRKGVVSDVER